MSRSAEGDILQEMGAKLNDTISKQLTPARFGNEMSSAGFVSERTVEDITTIGGFSKYEKVDKIMSAVKDYITTSGEVTQKFDQFILLLYNELRLKHLAQQLGEKLEGRKQGYQSPLRKGTQGGEASRNSNRFLSQGENVTSLPPKIRGNLKQQLNSNLREIEASFADYTLCILQSLEEKNVTVKKLTAYILRLTSFTCDGGHQELTLLSERKDEFKNAVEIADVFIALNDSTSFLNYDIYQRLIRKFKVANIELEELDYPSKLREYVEKHRVSEFIEVHPVLNKYTDDTKQLILILDIESTCRLSKLIDLGPAIADIMKLDQSTLLIHNIEEHCIIITFLIPIIVANVIFTGDLVNVFSPGQKENLRKLSIRQLKCNGYVFDFTEDIIRSTKHNFRLKMDVDEFVENNRNARGVVVIIGNEEYDDPRYNNLPGAMLDANAMESTFKYLQFAIHFLRNATRDEIFTTISTLACYGSYPRWYNCFAVVFSGHGGSNNIIVSSDGREVGIQEAIIEQLDVSRHIAHIPKIVFIDACRGEKEIRPRNKDNLTLPNGFFVAYATKNGYSSYEEESGGMWMQILAKELRSSKKSVCDTVADVNKEVNAKYPDYIQPQTSNTAVNIVLSAGLNVAADCDHTDEAEAASSQQTVVADGDDTDEAASSGYVSTLSKSVRPYLKKQLDWDNRVNMDLHEIAQYMTKWELHSARLGLTPENVDDIKSKDGPELQRREALTTWKNNEQLGATYEKLLKLSEDIKQPRWAEAICRVLEKRKAKGKEPRIS